MIEGKIFRNSEPVVGGSFSELAAALVRIVGSIGEGFSVESFMADNTCQPRFPIKYS